MESCSILYSILLSPPVVKNESLPKHAAPKSGAHKFDELYALLRLARCFHHITSRDSWDGSDRPIFIEPFFIGVP
jgi:hypothetical protein